MTTKVTTDVLDSPVLTGMLMMWSTGVAPTGWILCDGSAINRTTYADLFAVIGTSFGSGDGSTTFNVPDYRNKMPIGAGSTYSVGSTGGSADAIVVAHTHTGSTDVAGLHNHDYNDNSAYPISAGSTDVAKGTVVDQTSDAGAHSHTLTINSTGSSGTNANLPPYVGIQFIIKV
jgi:microcystin-dependent protein